MGGPFASYSFDLPKPILHLLSLLLLLFRPPPPPPPPQSQSFPFPSIKTRLPVLLFARIAASSSSPLPPACAVCLALFASTDAVRELGNCRHVFHRACIDRWIDADGSTCPLCRSPLLPSTTEEEAEEKGVFLLSLLIRRIRRLPVSVNLFISHFYADTYL